MKTALLFAGQGAQFIGMGKDLAEQFPSAKWLFEQANETLGYDLAAVCFNGPEEALTRTENAQPAIFLVSWIAFEVLRERLPTLTFEAVAGLSLGEFTALAAADTFSFEEGLKLVRQRGRFMSDAAASTRGAMAAVIGMEPEEARKVAEESGVEVANLNCPGQIVLSGEAAKIDAACELARTRGAKRVLPLAVGGAFHSKLMAAAKPKLQSALAKVPLRPPTVSVISNVTAEPHAGAEEISRLLVDQITSPVRWEDSMRYLLGQGFERFIELGPGTALTGFMKRIDRNARVLNVGNVASLKTTVQALVT